MAFQVICALPVPSREVLLGSLLTAVSTRGPIAGEVEALLRSALNIDDATEAKRISGGSGPVLLLAGSGKKGLRTPNISTPAALVAAAVGVRVVKVGSAATSSVLGSRDLVRALGLTEHRTTAGVQADLDTSGFAFVAIEPEIPALDRLYGGRFHAPNPFSFGLAPLVSPVHGDVTIFGLSHPRVDVAADVLSRFGMGQVEVFSTRLPGGYYVDEIATGGEVRSCRVHDGTLGPVEVTAIEDEPATEAPLAELPAPGPPADMVQRTVEVLTGGGWESHRSLVAVNAAFLMMRAGLVRSLVEGREMAEDAMRSGVALEKLVTEPR